MAFCAYETDRIAPMQELLKTLHQELQERLLQYRDMVDRQIDFLEMKNKISVAIGMRRTGKTFLMYHKIQSLLDQSIPITRILYIDFEDDRLLPMHQQGLGKLIDGFYSLFPENHHETCYLFLDEIHNIENWALTVRRISTSKNCRLYLSGSSAKLLSKEIATELRGRTITTEVFPFSFKEYLVAKNIKIAKAPFSQQETDVLQKYLTDYLEEGGFPGVIGEPPTHQTLTLQEYIDVVIFKDIVERHDITNIVVIRYMIHYLLKNNATSLSGNKFYHDLKSQGFSVGRSTVYDYLSYIEDAYLIFTVPLYAESVRKVQSNPKKIYAIDNGVVRASSLRLTKNEGRSFENLVYLDLRRQGHEIYYYLTQNGHEVDFLTRDLTGQLHLYQVASDATDSQTRQREMRALEEAQKELGIKGMLITKDNYINWKLLSGLQ
jgi:predicted AAA+ superfamily ATPase